MARSAGAYCIVNRPRRPRPKPDTIPEPAVTDFDDGPTTTEIPRLTPGTIDEAIHAMLDAGPDVEEPPPPAPRRHDALRDADPCNCAYCKEARTNGILYVQYDGATVLRPLAFIAEMAEVAGAEPMRFCPTTGKVIDNEAPAIVPWTTDGSPTPACCLPLRRAMDVERIDVPPFGASIAFTGTQGILLGKNCPWCGTGALELIRAMRDR